MTYTIQVHGSRSNGSPEEVSAEVEAAIRSMVQTLQAHGHTVGGGQTRLPDGRTIDALNIASGGPSTTAEPANSPARTTSEQVLAQSQAAQAGQNQPQAASSASTAASGATQPATPSTGAQAASGATPATTTTGATTGSRPADGARSGQDSTSTPATPRGGQGSAKTGTPKSR